MLTASRGELQKVVTESATRVGRHRSLRKKNGPPLRTSDMYVSSARQSASRRTPCIPLILATATISRQNSEKKKQSEKVKQKIIKVTQGEKKGEKKEEEGREKRHGGWASS